MLLPREKIKLIFLNKIKYICQPVNISKLNELKCVFYVVESKNQFNIPCWKYFNKFVLLVATLSFVI